MGGVMGNTIVQVSCEGNRGRVDVGTVRRRGERILEATGQENGELSIVLCDDAFIRHLNLEYRKIDRATDVLSFSMLEGEVLASGPQLLGDVIISVETAGRQANEAGQSLLEEVTFLLIHGILHLLGYDHGKPEDEGKMREEAIRIASLVK
jgi:probable rRNA maturation factor